MHVLRTGCLMLLPITNFSWLKEKEMYLQIVREVTDSHLQQNSLVSEKQDQTSAHRISRRFWHFILMGSLLFFAVITKKKKKKKITPSP